MTSDAPHAYVWVWLPNVDTPVVAGLLRRHVRDGYGFAYGRSYLARDDAISLFPDELPLQAGEQRQRDDGLPSCLRDAAPDAWGRRVIINRLLSGDVNSETARSELDELYGRMVFNILCGNTEDHARNHAAFWDGRRYRLTPAYDICPQARTGGEASQAMLLIGQRRDSRLAACLAAAPVFDFTIESARALIDHQIAVIGREWETVCDQAGLGQSERRAFWQRQFLNPYCFEGYPTS
jgi:hypothetical protein